MPPDAARALDLLRRAQGGGRRHGDRRGDGGDLRRGRSLWLAARRPRYGATTDSDHDQPIFANRAKDMVVERANQLWVSDITYVPIIGGFVYVAVILDAWSRRVVGDALSRSIDVRLTLAVLNAAVELRKPPAGCVIHSDRGSQSAATRYRAALVEDGLVGSMGRRGDPYDNAKAESFMKTVEGRGRLSDGVRDFRGRRRAPSRLHRRDLQFSPTLAAGIGKAAFLPRPVRQRLCEKRKASDPGSFPASISLNFRLAQRG